MKVKCDSGFFRKMRRDVIWILNPALRKITYVSPSVQKLRGYTPEEVMAFVERCVDPGICDKVKRLLSREWPSFNGAACRLSPTGDEVHEPCKTESVAIPKRQRHISQSGRTSRNCGRLARYHRTEAGIKFCSGRARRNLEQYVICPVGLQKHNHIAPSTKRLEQRASPLRLSR